MVARVPRDGESARSLLNRGLLCVADYARTGLPAVHEDAQSRTVTTDCVTEAAQAHDRLTINEHHRSWATIVDFSIKLFSQLTNRQKNND